MTREQAYQQADTENLFATDQTNTDIIFRAMAIFAGAFTEWANMESYVMGVYDGKVLWFKYFINNTAEYTTSQLIAEFEKIENK